MLYLIFLVVIHLTFAQNYSCSSEASTQTSGEGPSGLAPTSSWFSTALGGQDQEVDCHLQKTSFTGSQTPCSATCRDGQTRSVEVQILYAPVQGQIRTMWRLLEVLVTMTNDSSYVHQQPRHPQHQHGGAYTTGWQDWQDYQWQDSGPWASGRSKSPRKRTQSPRQRVQKQPHQSFKGDVSKGKGKGPSKGYAGPPSIYYKVSADSRVPSRLFSFGTLAIVVSTRPRALALHLLRAFLRSGIPGQDTTAFAHCV